MVKHTSTTTARDHDESPNSRSVHAPASHVQQIARYSTDDIILSLANAYENKRARQVTEWERSQATRTYRAA
jgi:hypothetical protein